MSELELDIDRIRPYQYQAMSSQGGHQQQKRCEWEIHSINVDFDTIRRIAQSIHGRYQIRVRKVGQYIEWTYGENPPLYLGSDGIFSHSHSYEAHLGAAMLISILVSKGAARATRGPWKPFRILNEPARELNKKLNIQDRKVLTTLATVEPLIKIGSSLLPEKQAKRLEKRGLIVIKAGYAEVHPDKKNVAAILYRQTPQDNAKGLPNEKIL